MWNQKADASSTITAKHHLITLDSTPYYLFASDRIPNTLCNHLCCPPGQNSSQLSEILPNELLLIIDTWHKQDDEITNQWLSGNDGYGMIFNSCEKLELYTIGKIRTILNRSVKSQREFEAWKRYVRNHNSQQIIGRGFYVISFSRYFQALHRAGRPASHLHVV